MEAKVHTPGVPFEEPNNAPDLQVAPARRIIWWKLLLAVILLAVVLVLAASAPFYSQQEDAPMQVEPLAIMV
jgi:hypothetical protein